MSVRGDDAVAFVYALKEVPATGLKLKGLDGSAHYRVEEINLPVGVDGSVQELSGRELMESGLSVPALQAFGSEVYRLRRLDRR